MLISGMPTTRLLKLLTFYTNIWTRPLRGPHLEQFMARKQEGTGTSNTITHGEGACPAWMSRCNYQLSVYNMAASRAADDRAALK